MADEKIITLAIRIRVLDEAVLREVAIDRMIVSGFETDRAVHQDKPLHELAFEALIGSNTDTMSPDQMGIELVDWTDPTL